MTLDELLLQKLAEWRPDKGRQTLDLTDEASAIEWLGHAPKLVQGSLRNFKVTYPEDFDLADAILSRPSAS